jgi:hypothetical protein
VSILFCIRHTPRYYLSTGECERAVDVVEGGGPCYLRRQPIESFSDVIPLFLPRVSVHSSLVLSSGSVMKVILPTSYVSVVFQTSRTLLKVSSGTDSDVSLESSTWMQVPDHMSRRCSKTSKSLKKTLKKSKRQSYGLKSLWDVRTKSTWNMTRIETGANSTI